MQNRNGVHNLSCLQENRTWKLDAGAPPAGRLLQSLEREELRRALGVAGGCETGEACPIRAIETELAANGLGADRIEANPPDFAADFEIVPAGLERKMIDELECIVSETQWAPAFVVTGTGEARNCELR